MKKLFSPSSACSSPQNFLEEFCSPDLAVPENAAVNQETAKSQASSEASQGEGDRSVKDVLPEQAQRKMTEMELRAAELMARESAARRKREQIVEMDRGIYDIKDQVRFKNITNQGLNEEVVKQISEFKGEENWMLQKRLDALKVFQKQKNPLWGPDLTPVDIDEIITYISPDAKMSGDWKELPEDILNTFERLGIPEAEYKQNLAGVGAQYDSEVVYHRLTRDMERQGVIYTDFETAVKKYPEMIQKYFGTLIRPELHKYSSLHYAVWSGGSYVYVPAGARVDIPLQSYFRLNAPGAGQFEHTLIIVEEGAYCHFIEGCSAPKYNVLNLHAGAVELFVGKNATLRYSTIENWSRNMYNLNTKRALVEEGGTIEWISGSFGSKVSMLYPASILKGKGARCEFVGISFAGAGQYLDTGVKVYHTAPDTRSNINTKSISTDGGTAVYRSHVRIAPNAAGSKSAAECESLMLDNISRSDTVPVIDINNSEVDLGHEAKIGRISDAQIFYLTSRGISEDEAKGMIVRGFAEPIARELPVEYASEMNKLIELELIGTIG